MTIQKKIKIALLHALKRAGVFSGLAASRWRKDKLLILCYHGISLEDEHEWMPSFYMTAATLESRLNMLRAGGFTVLPLADAVQRLRSHTLPEKSVAITFDDGLYNFYMKALPLLKKYGIPATLYLTTYYCYQNLPVFPLICSYLLWKKGGGEVAANPALGLRRAADLTTAAGRRIALDDLQAYSREKKMNAARENELARGLAAYLGLDFDALMSKRFLHLMTPDEVKAAFHDGIDIQLHTHRHRTPQDRDLFQKEITDNQEKIRELTGRDARHFCYPSGVHQPEFLPWLAEQGVATATTCDHGLAQAATNPLLLPRFLDSSNVSALEFESWLAGVGALLPASPFPR